MNRRARRAHLQKSSKKFGKSRAYARQMIPVPVTVGVAEQRDKAGNLISPAFEWTKWKAKTIIHEK